MAFDADINPTAYLCDHSALPVLHISTAVPLSVVVLKSCRDTLDSGIGHAEYRIGENNGILQRIHCSKSRAICHLCMGGGNSV